MIEIRGNHNNAIVFTDDLDATAAAQIRDVCDLPEYATSRIRVMPDVHSGVGATIGMTMTIEDKVSPSMVGVDIGCGIETVEIVEKTVDFARLDDVINRYIPAGRNVREKPHALTEKINDRLHELRCLHDVKLDRALLSIGTLGGGNHFIELSKNDEGVLYLIIHSGSRHLGLEIANLYQRLAAKDQKDRSRDLAYVRDEIFSDYINDMQIATEYAQANRQAMVAEIVARMGLNAVSSFSTIHNYIETETMILRKGAVSAKRDERLIIPLNMRDGSLICIGKGNPDWNQSAPHGAGRIMSRRAALDSLSLQEFADEMKNVYSSSVNRETLDESPMVYRQMGMITGYIAPTVDTSTQIKPIYNFKASE
jgi:RNA-splicing ligase RtcB